MFQALAESVRVQNFVRKRSISFTLSVCVVIYITLASVIHVMRGLYEFKPRSVVFQSYFQSTK